jgi:hypothetical protein
VLADSSIKRASATENPDLFWALKGAGASFGIITEFVCRTEPEPAQLIQFSYSFTIGSWPSMVPLFKAWQAFVSDPNLTRNFASEVVLSQAGMIISGTYYGTQAEYDAFDLSAKFPGHQAAKTIVFKDWLGAVAHWGEEVALRAGGGLAAPMFTKSLTFNGAHLIPDTVVDKLFNFIEDTDKGTLIWFVIFDLAGGAVNDVAQDATAYAHRDALFYQHSYAVGIPAVSNTTKTFLRGVNSTIKEAMPDFDFGCYAGYVDPELPDGPAEYWRTNLPRLEQIKAAVDPGDVFHNPQSVRPAGSAAAPTQTSRRRTGGIKAFVGRIFK